MTVVTSNTTPTLGYADLDPWFERLYVIFALWLISGAYYDAWTHTWTPELESFFTPAHGLLYAGGGMLVGLTLYTAVKNMAMGHSLKTALPRGYISSFVGGILFILGGIGDMFWHILFGIENDLEAAFSATHLFLVVAFVLLMGGPVFSMMARGIKKPSLTTNWPASISFMLMLSAFTVITQWGHPLVNLQATTATEEVDVGHSLGILMMIMQTVFLMALLLPLVYRQVLPVGSITFALTLNAAYLTWMNYAFVLIIPALLTGIVADIIYWKIDDFESNEVAFRVFALVVPAIFYSLYFIFLATFFTLAWNAHIISGGIFFPALISILLSYMVLPPVFE